LAETSVTSITKMKILYSQIVKLVPQLKANSREVGETLTMTGFMMDGLEKVTYQGKIDYLMSFEVRQNRPDCLSVFGLAKEVAAYFGLKIALPKAKVVYPRAGQLNIGVEAPKHVRRSLAVEINELKNKKSPSWLVELLKFYDINSINLLVDISNYAMLLTGYPSHLLDKRKVDGKFSWALNSGFKAITTLDGSQISLTKADELLIRDDKKVLGLAGIVGGQAAEIGLETDWIIAEMAVYDRVLIRKNRRDLRIMTEASNRLEKDLDPNGLDYAFNLLISLILENCGGKPVAKPFSFYPQKYISPKIRFNPESPSVYAGIDISSAKAALVLRRLGFAIVKAAKELMVAPPISRTDVLVKQDVVEEVVRLVGYDKIPRNQVPDQKVVSDITSRTIRLAEKVRDILSVFGYDEILSWPLTKKEINLSTNWREWGNIATQNSVNEEFPDLRQTIAASLLFQLSEYLKKNVSYINIFEIGKVFGKEKGKYSEAESLGTLSYGQKAVFAEFRQETEKLLRSLGFKEIGFRLAQRQPKIANSRCAWEISAAGKALGIIYKVYSRQWPGNVYFAEINLSEAALILEKLRTNPVVEFTKKLVILDANVELEVGESIEKFVEETKQKLGENNLWSIVIYDVFPLKEKNKIRYTIRTTYQELSDEEAKELHQKIFNLAISP